MGRALFFMVLYLAIAGDAVAHAKIALEYSGALHTTESAGGAIARDAEAAALQVIKHPSRQQVARNTEDTLPASEGQTDNPAIWGGLGLSNGLAIVAGAVTSVLLFRLATLILLNAPGNRLKEQVLLCAWTVIPLVAVLFAVWTKLYEIDFRLTLIAVLALLAWSDTFGALILGGRVRRLISATWKVPDPLSLPIATLFFSSVSTVIMVQFWSNGGLSLSSCIWPSPHPLFSFCQFEKWQGEFLVAVLLLFITACGAVLPPDSNLIRANRYLATLIRTWLANYRAKRQKRREEAKRAATETTSAEPGSYPVPALHNAPAVDAMRLKLKRSQRSSVLGKMIFMLDARMELTQDEYGLLRKYRLGNDVIYESSSRQRRKEQTLAHLEMTKGGPSLTDSAGTQMWGAAKSLFSLGRAGVSAATAALSLRVTIDSLISGVHVECKSMNELLEAEWAIREAAQNLRGYLDIAVTFDGREEIVELR